MSLASFEDVDTRFHRDIAPEDRPLVEARLADAENKIRRRIPDLDDRIVSDPGLRSVVVSVCCDAVIRLIHNPEGYVQETDGNYSYMREQGLSSRGKLTITPEEWADLGVRQRVGVVHTVLDLPRGLR